MTGRDEDIEAVGKRSSALVWAGLLISAVIFAILFRNIEWRRFLDAVKNADLLLLSLIPLSIAAEQLLRAVKWRELLKPFARLSIIRLYGAIMAGYFSNYLAPVKISFLMRAWIAARAGKVSTSTVLGTVMLGRVIDGIVFVPLVLLAATTITLDQHGASVTSRLLWGALGSLVLLLALCWLFLRWAKAAKAGSALPEPLLSILPDRWSGPVERFTALFAEGTGLPSGLSSLALIFSAALVMKIMAAAHLALAGYAFAVDLSLLDYLFVMVCLGFAVVIASTLKIVGGFIAGAVILLQQFGVTIETATAMALSVSIASRLTVIASGAPALWYERFDLSLLKLWARRGVDAADDIRISPGP
ncbi:MAG: lysylphosphatidylglycerol synthase transmembrane domain-containing protein [Geminicoccaceae bacterium]